MIQKFVLMPRTFYAFLYNFFFLLSVSVSVLLLCRILCYICAATAVKMLSVCPLLPANLFPEANRNLCNIINPFAFLISNSAWPERKDVGQGYACGRGGPGLLQSRCHTVPRPPPPTCTSLSLSLTWFRTRISRPQSNKKLNDHAKFVLGRQD